LTALRATAGLLAAVLIALSLWQITGASRGIAVTPLAVEGIPATLYRPASGGPAPVVVIAHGFAGSQQLMQSFALSLARNGYAAVTFDFAGHGRSTRAMNGDLALIEGATQRLLGDLAAVAAEARKLGDGRLAVLGHSMASDIVVRFAERDPSVEATIAVSMFSPAVTAESPRNLLIIVGQWEGMLKEEALRAVSLAIAPRKAEPFVTYGDFSAGTARRAAFSPHVEHASVLFSAASMREAVSWLDQSFGIARQGPPESDGRGPWIIALFAGIVLMAWPLSSLLPRVSTPSAGAGLSWRRLWPGLLIPMLATPLILRVTPTHFLPVLVADYLALHFLVYGAIVLGFLLWQRRRGGLGVKAGDVSPRAFLVAVLCVIAYGLVALVWPLDGFVTSFIPVGDRPILVGVLLVGTLLYFLSDEWLTRGEHAAKGAYAASKLAFLGSLAIAVALDLEQLFFLIIIVPVIALFFIVYGLLSRWVYRATGNPLVAGLASALAFAWAIGVTFPLIAG
jgi:pimeloyl-ACP methyl ester carboxylesterase